MSLNDLWLQLNKDSWICVFNSSMELGRIGVLSADHTDTWAQNTAVISSHA